MPDTGKLREELAGIRADAVRLGQYHEPTTQLVIDLLARLAAVVEGMLPDAEPDYVSPPMEPVGKFVGRFVPHDSQEKALAVAIEALEKIGKGSPGYYDVTTAKNALSQIAALKSGQG